ncbi:hypothetical protein FRC06_005479, partial [Ceratobasidium sp. 370]
LKDLGNRCTGQYLTGFIGQGETRWQTVAVSKKGVTQKSNGDLNIKVTTSKESTSQASSTSVHACSTSPMAISLRSSSVVSKHKTSAGSCTCKLARMSTHTYCDRSDELDLEASLYEDEDLGEIGATEGEESNRKAKPKMSDYPPDVSEILDATVEAIKYQVTSYQGWVKEAIKVAGLVQYNKLDTGTGMEIAAWVSMLTSNNHFHTKISMPKGTSFYQDKFIQMAINGVLFTAKKKKALIVIKYEDKF